MEHAIGHESPRYAPRAARLAAATLMLVGFAFSAGTARAQGQALPIRATDRARLEHAANDPKLDLPLRALLYGKLEANSYPDDADLPNTGPAGWTGVMIRGTASREALTAAGAQVMTQAGGVTTALIHVASLPDLLKVPGVAGVDAPREVEKFLNQSCQEIAANVLWGGTPPNILGLTGRGVVIGIVDSGIDITHADFKNSSNQTRIKYFWDQNGFGTLPGGFTYGCEWTSAQIDAGTATSGDSDGHGTHLAGVAASNGRATGNGYAAYRYVGVAPEADLIVVKCLGLDYSIIDGANYIFQRAAALGEDAVVLISAGNQRGGHDGTTDLDHSLSALTGPGKLIVAATGNNGLLAIHSSLNLPTDGSSGTMQMVIPTYSPATGEFLDIETWHDANTSFQVRLTSPTGIQSAWIQPGAQTGNIGTADGAYLINNDILINSQGAKQIRYYLWWLGGTNPKPKSGTWTLEVQRLSGSVNGQLNSWVAGWKFGSGGVSPAFSNNIDYSELCASPSTADSAIGVGAYVTRTTWTDFHGQIDSYADNPTLQSIANFSSCGPRRDGVQRPDVLAPGEGVVSALSAACAGAVSNFRADDGVHWIDKGTSVSAAHVAGALALFLQQTPHLSPSAARLIIRSHVRTDSFTGSVPNNAWGYGKLDLTATPTSAGPAPAPSGTVFAMSPAYPNPSRRGVRFDFNLASSDLTRGATVRLQILDVRGREVVMIPGSPEPGAQAVTWNGLDSRGEAVTPGVYLGRLEVGSKSAERKFVKLP